MHWKRYLPLPKLSVLCQTVPTFVNKHLCFSNPILLFSHSSEWISENLYVPRPTTIPDKQPFSWLVRKVKYKQTLFLSRVTRLSLLCIFQTNTGFRMVSRLLEEFGSGEKLLLNSCCVREEGGEGGKWIERKGKKEGGTNESKSKRKSKSLQENWKE